MGCAELPSAVIGSLDSGEAVKFPRLLAKLLRDSRPIVLLNPSGGGAKLGRESLHISFGPSGNLSKSRDASSVQSLREGRTNTLDAREIVSRRRAPFAD